MKTYNDYECHMSWGVLDDTGLATFDEVQK